jgi:hypothetical protein
VTYLKIHQIKTPAAAIPGRIRLRMLKGAGVSLKRASRTAACGDGEVLTKDNGLYQHIKAGMREYDWQNRDQKFRTYKDGEVIFENAHLKIYHVDHFAETRVGFYFKDLNECGLYGFFAGDGDETFESYYRTDSTFKKEGRLLYDDD